MWTDAEVIAASLTEADAFEAIFDRHFSAISRYLRRRLRHPIADELAAEAFTTAFAGRRSYDLDRPTALPWLYGIAANLVRRHARDEERELHAYSRTGIDPVVASDSEPLERLLRQDLEPRVAQALTDLDPGDREVLLLFAWANLGYEEIGCALVLPLGTVKSRLNRARGQVRASLESLFAAPTEEEAVNG
ncbi:MAG: RNA polymerase sigma factor [Gaiellaceae bacterium]